jgi:hypothetical protein
MSILSNEEQKAAEQAESYGSFESLPAGRYACQLVEFHPHTTGTSFWVRWRIANGQKYGGRTFLDFPSNKPEYLGKVKSIFEALGRPFSADENDLVGLPAWVHVTEEFDNRPEHQGEKQNKVKFVSKYDGSPLPEYQRAGSGDPDADIPFTTDGDGSANEEDLV